MIHMEHPDTELRPPECDDANILNPGHPDCCYFIQYGRVQSTVCSTIQSVKMSKYKDLVETSKDQKSYVTATLCACIVSALPNIRGLFFFQPPMG
jgi:hypothetical protein